MARKSITLLANVILPPIPPLQETNRVITDRGRSTEEMIIFLHRGEGKFLGDEKERKMLENGFNKINTTSSTLPSLEFAHEEDRRYNNILGVAGASNSREQSRWLRRDSFLLRAGSFPPHLLPSLVLSFLFLLSLFFYIFQYEFNPRNAGNGADSSVSLHEINAFNLSTLGRGKCDGSMKQGFNAGRLIVIRIVFGLPLLIIKLLSLDFNFSPRFN